LAQLKLVEQNKETENQEISSVNVFAQNLMIKF
jgi:hypothetical protein